MNDKVRFSISDVDARIRDTFDAICDATGLTRGDAFHCLILDVLAAYPVSREKLKHQDHQHWQETARDFLYQNCE